MKSLKDVKVGETATVVKLHGEGATKRRIMDMGITKGVEIHVRKDVYKRQPWRRRLRYRTSPRLSRRPSLLRQTRGAVSYTHLSEASQGGNSNV